MRRLLIMTAALVVLSACSGEPEVREPDPDANSASPSPSATPPKLPEQARGDSPEGAVAFASHWVDVNDYAALTGDLDPLREITDAGCTGCNRLLEMYERVYSAGGYFEGGDTSLQEPVRFEQIDEQTWDVNAEVESESGKFRESENADVQEEQAGSSSVTYTVRFEDGRWTMMFQVLSEE